MAAIKAISRYALPAFSPTGPYIAAGTAGLSVDASFDSNHCVELFELDFASDAPDLPLVGCCSINDNLTRLTWSTSGLLAGALADGSIDIWSVDTLISDHQNNAESRPWSTLEAHQEKILGLEFSPLTPNLLASGGADGVVHVWDCESLPVQHFPPLQARGAEGPISFLSWNRKTAHILATTSEDGFCAIWDLKKQKHLISLSNHAGKKKYSSFQWHPEAPTQLAVAVDDDAAPAIQLWDLRSPAKPIQELFGHSKGVHSLAWCPHDSSMLLSCGKDNRTLCWDVTSKKIIGELPGSNSWNLDVQWSPRTPGILSTASHDAITIHSIEKRHYISGESPVVFKAPKWLKRPVGSSFGFGGKLVTFSKKHENSSEVKVHTLQMEEDTVKHSSEFEEAVSATDRKSSLKSFCDRKASEAESEHEKDIWTFLKVMLENQARSVLLVREKLGFHFSEEEVLAQEFEQKAEITSETQEHTEEISYQMVGDADEFFENLQAKEEESVSVETNGKEEEGSAEDHELVNEMVDSVQDTNREVEDAIEQALVVGNFKKAVDLCLSIDRVADALLIAYTAGPAMFERTQNEYVKKCRRSYLQVLTAITTHKLNALVESRPLTAWKETLALFATYAKGEDWSSLTNALAERLYLAGDIQAATICYICAGNVEKTVEVLSRTYNTEVLGNQAVNNLQDLVEKSIVLAVATNPEQVSPALARLVERYVELLASQGLLESALAYVSLVPGDLSKNLTYLERAYKTNPVVPAQEPQHVTPSITHQQPYVANYPYNYGPSQQQQPPVRYPNQGQVPSLPNTFAPKPSSPYSSNTFVPKPSSPYSSNTFVPRPSAPYNTPNPYTPASVPQAYPQTNRFNPTPFAPPAEYARAAPPPFPGTQVPPPPPTTGTQALQGPPAARPFTPPQAPMNQFQRPTAPQFEPQNFGFLQPNVNQAGPPPSTMVPRPVQAEVRPPVMFTPVRLPAQQVPPTASQAQPTAQAQPLGSHLTENAYAPPPPAPAPTVQNVDTTNVKDEYKPVVNVMRRLFSETAEALEASGPVKRREIEDNSKKLGTLFVKLNADEFSPTVSTKIITLSQGVESHNYQLALDIATELTTTYWDECGGFVNALRRMLKMRQQMQQMGH